MGHSDLNYLIKHMHPELLEDRLVFISVSPSESEPHIPHARAMVREDEGITLVVTTSYADNAHLNYDGVYRQISLAVESDLEAVGLTAAFATALGKDNIPANVIAGYYHDHILVPESLAEKALSCLINLTRQST